jgi:hypothetical protein
VIKTLGGLAATVAGSAEGGLSLIGEGVKDFLGGIKKQK